MFRPKLSFAKTLRRLLLNVEAFHLKRLSVLLQTSKRFVSNAEVFCLKRFDVFKRAFCVLKKVVRRNEILSFCMLVVGCVILNFYKKRRR